MNSEYKKYLFGILGVMGFFAIFLVVSFFYRKAIVKKDAVFVLAKIYKIDSSAEGVNYKFWYKYKGVKYESEVLDLFLNQQNGLILLEISSRSPDFWILHKNSLPECLLKNANFDTTWRSFPKCDK